ncbi:MAG: hypothetical protein ABUS57_15970 [Pseudomonadota bacterium]
MSTIDGVPISLRRLLLSQMKGEAVLDREELALFDWYARESSKLIEKMLEEERAYIQEQVDSGVDRSDANDSGLFAVEYYTKRARYADIIYMASLLETYLARACDQLTVALGNNNIIFRPDELSGDKWSKRRKFLERYGAFTFPEDVWSMLETLVRVRNILVHENGSSASISNSDRKEIQCRRGIAIGTHELEIEDKYVEDCLSAFRDLDIYIRQQITRAIDRSLCPSKIEE